MKKAILGSLAISGLLLTGCTGDGGDGDGGNGLIDGLWTQSQFDAFSVNAFGAIPEDKSNEYRADQAAAVLGQQLYFEDDIAGYVVDDNGGTNHYGAEGEIMLQACTPCHGGDWGSDVTPSDSEATWPTSLGAKWGDRNTPPTVNVAFYTFFYWDGRADSMWRQASAAYQNGAQQAGSRLQAAHILCDEYESETTNVFGDFGCGVIDSLEYHAAGDGNPGKGDAAGTTYYDSLTDEEKAVVTQAWVYFGKAIHAYEAEFLLSGNSPFDQYVAGDFDALTAQQKAGMGIFFGKAACSQGAEGGCHSGPGFTANDYRNIGVPQEGDHVAEVDKGRYQGIPKMPSALGIDGAYSDDASWGSAKLTPVFNQCGGKGDDGKVNGELCDESLTGLFRVKHLRQVAETAPYMHTGGLASLEDVIDLYNDPGTNPNYSGELDATLVPLGLSAEEKGNLRAFLDALTGDPIPAEYWQDTQKENFDGSCYGNVGMDDDNCSAP
jgi:cytochrome c peroxidase